MSLAMENHHDGKPVKSRKKSMGKKVNAFFSPFTKNPFMKAPFMKERVYHPLQKEKHAMQHGIDLGVFQDTHALVKIEDHFSELQVGQQQQQQQGNLNEPKRQGHLAAEGKTFTYFSGLTAMLDIQNQNLEASYQEVKDSHRKLQTEVASLRGKLLDSGEDAARLKRNLAAEQDSCSFFAKQHSELEAKTRGLEARITEERKNSATITASMAEELTRVQSNLNAESETCSFFSQAYKELEGKVQELESALRRAKAEPAEGEKSVCQICLEQPRNALCIPCRHFVCCNQCLMDHLKRNKKCPMCRVPVESTIECYT